MADIFISYSKAYRADTEALAHELELKGFTVWWDTSLLPGDDFKDEIMRQIAEARAAIVIWSKASVKSDWVYSEAKRARLRQILIPVRVDVELEDIPPPFESLHTELVSNRAAIDAALARLGVVPLRDFPKPSPLSDAAIAEATALAHWEAIKGATSPKQLHEFLGEFGTSKLARLARERLARLASEAWARMPRRRTAADLRKFLADFPDMAEAKLADEELAALRNAEAERAFRAAMRADTVSAVDEFLAAYPELAAQGEKLRRELLSREEAFNVAKTSNDAAVLKEFVRKYPDSAPAKEIRARLRYLEPPNRLILSVCIVAGCIIGLLLGWWWGTVDPSPSALTGATRNNANVDRPPTDFMPPIEDLATQKVVLYEEEKDNPNGTQFGGTAIWRTERVAPAPGQKPDVVIRGEIEIPEQKMSVRLTVRRNDDKQLPASHTVEIMFALPPDFSHGGIANIPGIMMKQGETTHGVALNGVAVKVTNNFFLVGLSSVEADMQRNVQLLKERSWFDIPVVYGDGKRALIAIEKGIPGERAFSEAFAAWEPGSAASEPASKERERQAPPGQGGRGARRLHSKS